jgi:hypothetical protein
VRFYSFRRTVIPNVADDAGWDHLASCHGRTALFYVTDEFTQQICVRICSSCPFSMAAAPCTRTLRSSASWPDGWRRSCRAESAGQRGTGVVQGISDRWRFSVTVNDKNPVQVDSVLVVDLPDFFPPNWPSDPR